MKNLISTTLVMLAMAISSYGQVRVAPYLGYGNELGLWGLGGYAEVLANERVGISAFFTQYFPEELDNLPRRSAWELNTNINYYVINGDVGYLYGLAGLNYTHMRIRTRTVLSEEVEKDSNFGVNVGLGSMVRISDLLLPFVEAKYTAGGYSQASIIIGVKFQLGERAPDDDY